MPAWVEAPRPVCLGSTQRVELSNPNQLRIVMVSRMRNTPHSVFSRLHRAYGPQNWWPARSRFEVMVGAILTQNTSWTNVEAALKHIKHAKLLDSNKLAGIAHRRLAVLIKPVGYFNVKATRLQSYCRWYNAHGQFKQLNKLDTPSLRSALLDVHGIGPETADDILLYAFEREVFVIDAYTRRLFSRLGLLEGHESYEVMRAWFETKLKRQDKKVSLFNEFHALIVHHAKYYCRARTPVCADCCLQRQCQYDAVNGSA